MYLTDTTVDQIIDALAAWLAPFTGNSSIVRSEVNRVPMPLSPCVVLTEILQVRLERPITAYQPSADPGTATIKNPTRIDVQADFYGPNAGEYCQAVKSAFHTLWGFDQFPANIKPLYTDDGRQAPLTTGEQQYERRWILTLSLQYNSTITVPQDFADEAAPNQLVPVDIFYDAQ